MLRAGLLSSFILVAACAEEQDFDTRYEEAEASIAEKAEAIDAELAAPAVRESGDGSDPKGSDKE